MKGEVTRSLSYGSNSDGSTPRAGLQSSQLGTIHEPPLQRKRMVPYEKNHNIFTTVTVKEQPDREWLKTDGESYRSRSPSADRRHKEVLERDLTWLKWLLQEFHAYIYSAGICIKSRVLGKLTICIELAWLFLMPQPIFFNRKPPFMLPY